VADPLYQQEAGLHEKPVEEAPVASNPSCSVDDGECSEPGGRITRGMCGTHYGRAARADALEPLPSPPRFCTAIGCGDPSTAAGLCAKHYQRRRKYGNENFPVKERGKYGGAAAFIAMAVAYEGDECLLWPYGVNASNGYGSLHVGKKTWYAHRRVLWLVAGPPPQPGMYAAHKPVVCHNRLCVAPRHLRWDTPSGNLMDKVLDNTHMRGTRHHNAKLDVPKVRQIRADQRHPYEISLDYGVSEACIRAIQSRKNWAWLED
jgi:hypothetical protein